MNYKRGKQKTKLPDLPKNGSWSRMIHKWWLRDRKNNMSGEYLDLSQSDIDFIRGYVEPVFVPAKPKAPKIKVAKVAKELPKSIRHFQQRSVRVNKMIW